MSSSGPYRVLGVPPHATGGEIKQAYKAMALRWHPDRHPADAENATRCFLEVQRAYQTLMRERSTLDAHPSPAYHHTKSASTYQTGSSNSETTLNSPIHASSPSFNSLVTPASTVESNMPCRCHSSRASQWKNGECSGAIACTPRYSSNDQSQKPSVSPVAEPPPTRPKAEHPKPCSKKELNHISPSSPDLTAAKASEDSGPFIIIPPARKQSSLPRTTNSRDFYFLDGSHQTIQLHCFGIGPSKEWVYGLGLSLEELLNGKICSFSLSRALVTGETKKVALDVEIPPGCREGTRILCRGVGHEQKDGTRQDIVFVIEQLNHEHFLRVCDDLLLKVKIPYGDYLRHQKGDHFVVEGLDRRKHPFHIKYDRTPTGEHVIRGSGMPVRHQGQVVGRGNLIVQWEVLPQQSKVFGFMKRFMHFRR